MFLLSATTSIRYEEFNPQTQNRRNGTKTKRYRTLNKSKRSFGIEKFPCPNCDCVYNRLKNLTQHLKYACNRKPRFACPYCNYLNKRTCGVYNHVRSKHEGCKVSCIDMDDGHKTLTPREH